MDKVLCLVKYVAKEVNEDILWLDNGEKFNINPDGKVYRYEKIFIPLYNHPHNDIENGQVETHYHQDTRYYNNSIDESQFKSYKNSRISLPLEDGETLQYMLLKRYRNNEFTFTPTSLIKNSKLKHKCIHKGKCPHRGFDLTNTEPIYDHETKGMVIRCPLHGLKFNKYTKKLIE